MIETLDIAPCCLSAADFAAGQLIFIIHSFLHSFVYSPFFSFQLWSPACQVTTKVKDKKAANIVRVYRSSINRYLDNRGMNNVLLLSGSCWFCFLFQTKVGSLWTFRRIARMTLKARDQKYEGQWPWNAVCHGQDKSPFLNSSSGACLSLCCVPTQSSSLPLQSACLEQKPHSTPIATPSAPPVSSTQTR